MWRWLGGNFDGVFSATGLQIRDTDRHSVPEKWKSGQKYRTPPKFKQANDRMMTNRKAHRETQTQRAGCRKAEPKKFRPAADPLPGGAGREKFNQLEMVTLPTNPVW